MNDTKKASSRRLLDISVLVFLLRLFTHFVGFFQFGVAVYLTWTIYTATEHMTLQLGLVETLNPTAQTHPLFYDHRVIIVDAFYGGQGVVGDAMIAEELTAMRKTFLYEKTHTDDLCTGLTA